VAVTFRPLRPLKDAEILALSEANPAHRFERTAKGELVVAPPLGMLGAIGEGELFVQLAEWNKRAGLGLALPSSAGFRLPDTSLRGPDASWLSPEQVAAIPKDQREGFPRVCPRAVFELMSASDSRPQLIAKMDDYIANGARIAVLIDPRPRTVEIHRPGKRLETLVDPVTVALDPELPGFELELAPIFDPG
jgi:Uma2 family endonuclease